jgi:hypothetical protein
MGFGIIARNVVQDKKYCMQLSDKEALLLKHGQANIPFMPCALPWLPGWGLGPSQRQR